ncbi:SacI homology domain-containing protein [Phyllosticta capitalensis]|uniref:phosphoinositide 5-phosphatase n=1 Tax=Phyllosticta capitalensis TaxID=121624 RepID=A0ABR1Z101_9PEZI
MSTSIRVLIRDYPHRSIALATESHVLVFRHSSSSTERSGNGFYSGGVNASQSSVSSAGGNAPKCMVEFSESQEIDLGDYRSLSSQSVHGTLGLITVNNDVFLCVVSAATRAATVRPGETVQKILSVNFYCLNRGDYDEILYDEINPYPTDAVDEEGFDTNYYGKRGDNVMEHPCMALKKLLSSGTFYYSSDFDVTKRLQDRSTESTTVALDSLDAGFLWNSYMIQPLVDFRSRLSQSEKTALDSSGFLTSAIRGFASTFNVPASSSPARSSRTGLPSQMTLISRLSSRRAGTRFNARGMDDTGAVANFVESETIFHTPDGVTFSYVQVRGSVPLFWEQATGLLPGQQKVSITRSPEATQPAFDKHFENLELAYGPVHVVNLLSAEKPAEVEISDRYRHHIQHSSLLRGTEKNGSAGHELLKLTEYDFHAETRGPNGYEAASLIARYIQDSAEGFAYYLSEEVEERPKSSRGEDQIYRRPTTILQQEGVFRTNCLDCLDRTNLVQTIISRMALEVFLAGRGERGLADFWHRHGTLWADNGDALSKIYAGTGALKSSFTRSGKMSLAGAIADARKSAQRMYINNFADKGRQNTIDMLLGRLVGQYPVHLFDPINDYVMSELNRRAGEFSSERPIHIWVGTFNLNGKTDGLSQDLSSWVCPDVDPSQQFPEIVAVGFQEIVELSPQQIMSTDPVRRQEWESAVKRALNENAQAHGQEEYVALRGGQLVGASLSVFVKASVLKFIKNVEGSLKKTGMSGMAGNKGAVAIRMDFADTSLCFVTAHLAAGFANYEERNRDYRTISHGLRFQRNRSIEDHDTIIWLGDFNYRIGLRNEEVRKLVEIGDLETLYANDQLNLQMVHGLTFPFYSEARITFAPTYKYDNGTDRYDTSEKARIPAWCDRVLMKGTNLRQINYNTAPLRFSDHRPVYATFLCNITMIDERKKDELAHTLYQKRKGMVGHATATGSQESSDEDLIGYDPIDPTLPPASSDRRKWWFDNGKPSGPTIQPPGDDFAPNPNRPSNPWTASDEPDWVKVAPGPKQPPPPPAPRGTTANRTRTPSAASTASGRRILPPPLEPTRINTPPLLPARSNSTASNANRPIPSLPPRRAGTFGFDGSTPPPASKIQPTSAPISRKASPPAVVPRKPTPPGVPPHQHKDLARSASTSSTGSTGSVRRKPAPPTIPKKPGNLVGVATGTSSASSPPPVTSSPVSLPLHSKSFGQTPSSNELASAAAAKKKTFAPPPDLASSPKPAAVGGNANANGSVGGAKKDKAPPPPLPKPRRGNGLMDDREEEMDQLGGWEVLRPG